MVGSTGADVGEHVSYRHKLFTCWCEAGVRVLWVCIILTCDRRTPCGKAKPLCWSQPPEELMISYLSAGELKREASACLIWCNRKAKILVITPPPVVLSQFPFYLLLFLQSRACSSVGISVSGSSEQGSGSCQSHYITRPRYCSSAWPGWRDDHRSFVFPTFPFSSRCCSSTSPSGRLHTDAV